MTAWRVDPEWAARYERLRAHATGEAPLGFLPLGLALLRHGGVAAWMAAQGSSGHVESRAQAGRERDGASRDADDARRCELVRLLADAALRIAP